MGVSYKLIPACYTNPSIGTGGFAYGGIGAFPLVNLPAGGVGFGGLGSQPIVGNYGGGFGFGGFGVQLVFPSGFGGFGFGGIGSDWDHIQGKGGFGYGGIGSNPLVALPSGGFAFGGLGSEPADPCGPLVQTNWYKFSEGSGTTIADSIGGHDMTLQGSATWSMDSATNKYSISMNYNGGAATSGTWFPAMNGPFTFFCRAKITTLDSSHIFDFMSDAATQLAWNAINPGSYQSIGNGFWDGGISTFPSDPRGSWHSFGFAFCTGSNRYFFDGVRISDSAGSNTPSTSTGPVYIGMYSFGGRAVGYLTDYRFFTGRASDAQMLAMHNDTTL